MIKENLFATFKFEMLSAALLNEAKTFRGALHLFGNLFQQNTESDYTMVIAQEIPSKNEYLYQIEVARCIGWKLDWEDAPSVLSVRLRYKNLRDWNWSGEVVFGCSSEPLAHQKLYSDITGSDLFLKYADCLSDCRSLDFQGAENFEKTCEWFPGEFLEDVMFDNCSDDIKSLIRRAFTAKE